MTLSRSTARRLWTGLPEPFWLEPEPFFWSGSYSYYYSCSQDQCCGAGAAGAATFRAVPEPIFLTVGAGAAFFKAALAASSTVGKQN